jgi:uncharacterized protein YecE (DUF72 family)
MRINAGNNNTNASRIKRVKHEYIRDKFDIIRDELVGLKLAIEFRHKSWLNKETYNFLKIKKLLLSFQIPSLAY